MKTSSDYLSQFWMALALALGFVFFQGTPLLDDFKGKPKLRKPPFWVPLAKTHLSVTQSTHEIPPETARLSPPNNSGNKHHSQAVRTPSARSQMAK